MHLERPLLACFDLIAQESSSGPARRTNRRFDLKQTSSAVDGTQSLAPAVAREATSCASERWSVCKTQLLLPRITSTGITVSSPPVVTSVPVTPIRTDSARNRSTRIFHKCLAYRAWRETCPPPLHSDSSCNHCVNLCKTVSHQTAVRRPLLLFRFRKRVGGLEIWKRSVQRKIEKSTTDTHD